MHQVVGVLKGEGRWKVGQCVITVLGCHGSHPEQAEVYAAWQGYLDGLGVAYATHDEMLELAKAKFNSS